MQISTLPGAWAGGLNPIKACFSIGATMEDLNHSWSALWQHTAAVVFTNGADGIAIIPEIIGQLMPGENPAFAWLNYDHISSERRVVRLASCTLILGG